MGSDFGGGFSAWPRSAAVRILANNSARFALRAAGSLSQRSRSTSARTPSTGCPVMKALRPRIHQ
jgi:hypothetical protein